MHKEKRWNIPQFHPSAGALAAQLRTSPIIAQILLNRGLDDFDQCRQFLSPSLKHLHNPALIFGLTRAAQRIVAAIKAGEKMVIYGDYDVDGITGTSILWHAIKILGGRADYYIPHRMTEGYGLNPAAVEKICADGAKLLITVDCGITGIKEAQIVRQHGVDLIITDHHEWRNKKDSNSDPNQDQNQNQDDEPEYGSRDDEDSSSDQNHPLNTGSDEDMSLADLPDCHALVHPRLRQAGQPAYPNPALCGAGVAFKLAWGIGQEMNGPKVSPSFRDFLVQATALAALGTIADVVPLIGENRVIASNGLHVLPQSQMTGIQALISSAGLEGRALDSRKIGFILAPRLNACGRLGHAQLVVEMFTHADAARAKEIAAYLEAQNKARQALERQILEQALAQINELGLDNDECRGFVLGQEGWHPGVIGIVASRIVDRFHRPTVMVALNNGSGHGSARSIAGFNLARAFTQCADILTKYGGHAMAAGCQLDSAHLGAFRQAFAAHAHAQITLEMLRPRLDVECAAPLQQITLPLIQALARFEPFGCDNRKPLLACLDVEITAPPRSVGKNGEHLQLQICQGNTRMKGIGFNLAHWQDKLTPGCHVDLVVEPKVNQFNGYTNVELEIKDIRLAGGDN